MQKALTLMNVHLHHVISDISGLTGLSIVRAIVGGERDPKQLARLRDPRIRASKETIQKSLEGNWQEELLFDLKIALENYDHFQRQIAAYDEQIRQELKEVPSKVDLLQEPLPAARLRTCCKRPGLSQQDQLDLREELYRISGVDLTRIDGISSQTAQKVFFEIGTDVSSWSDEKKFTSWLRLSPNHRISGGKVLKRSSRKVVNPLSVALRLTAHSLLNSHSALGANFRRLIAKIGMPQSHHRHGQEISRADLPNAQVWNPVRRQGHATLRSQISSNQGPIPARSGGKTRHGPSTKTAGCRRCSHLRLTTFFWPKTVEKRKHSKLLTISEIHPVFMGSRSHFMRAYAYRI